ncbi:MAG: sugar transferase [Clostridia bacterium]|nr:sugar transferase [Clostridia bacterium]
MQNEAVYKYCDILTKKKYTFFLKRFFDIIISFLALFVLAIPFAFISIWIILDSKGSAFFVQRRVGKYNKDFGIIKFRTMVSNASELGGTLTSGDNDNRITKAGRFLRKFRIDELPQLINVLIGQMSIIGPRPEVRRFVDVYTDEQMATLIVRPGISCSSSVAFANEGEILEKSSDPDDTYIAEILPDKAQMNLDYISTLSLKNDLKIIFNTIKEVLR